MISSIRALQELKAYLAAMKANRHNVSLADTLEQLVEIAILVAEGVRNSSENSEKIIIGQMLANVYDQLGLQVVQDGTVVRPSATIQKIGYGQTPSNATIEGMFVVPESSAPNMRSVVVLRETIEWFLYVYSCVASRSSWDYADMRLAADSIEQLFRIASHLIQTVENRSAVALDYVLEKTSLYQYGIQAVRK